MNPRLLQVNMGDLGGGAQQISLSLHQVLRNQYHTTMLVGQKHSNDFTIEAIHTPRLLTYANLLLGLEYMLYPSTFGLKKHVLFQQADLVHYHNLHGYYFNLLALPKLTALKPSIWTFHDMWPLLGHAAHSLDCVRCEAGKVCHEHKALYPKLYTWDSSAFLYRQKHRILQQAQFEIVVPSQWLKNKVAKSFLQDKPIHLIYNGIDTELFKPQDKPAAKQALGFNTDQTVISFLAAGGLSNPWKGGQFIQKLLEHFKGQPNILFISIGGIDPSLEHYSNLKQIGFVNDRQQLAQYYSASDLFISPTLAESFGLTIAEAMACGTPSVAFAVGGVPEVIDHLINGYLAKPNDLDDLIAGIDYLLTPERVHTFATAARQKIVQQFPLERMVQQYSNLYQEVLAKAR